MPDQRLFQKLTKNTADPYYQHNLYISKALQNHRTWLMIATRAPLPCSEQKWSTHQLKTKNTEYAINLQYIKKNHWSSLVQTDNMHKKVIKQPRKKASKLEILESSNEFRYSK